MQSVISKSSAFRGVNKLTPLTVIRELRQHFYRATVCRDYKFNEPNKEEIKKMDEEPTNIDREKPFQAFIFEEL